MAPPGADQALRRGAPPAGLRLRPLPGAVLRRHGVHGGEEGSDRQQKLHVDLASWLIYKQLAVKRRVTLCWF